MTESSPHCRREWFGTLFAVWHGMKMIRLQSEQRRVLTDKVPDAANFVLGALFVGQLVGDRPFSFSLAAFGLLVWVALLGFVLVVAGMEEPR